MEKSGSKAKHRNYIMTAAAALFAAALLLFVYLGAGIWKEYQKTIIDNQKQQMLLTARSLGNNLEVFIEEYEADLDGLWSTAAHAYEAQDETEGQNRFVLKDYVESHSPFVHDVILEDGSGRVINSIRDSHIEEVFSSTGIGNGLTLRQTRLADESIDLVLSKKLAGGGALSLILDAKACYQSLISGIRLGSNGYVVVKDSNGIILMHPEEEQWGIDVITGREQLYPDKDLSSLKEMTERQNKGEEGVSEYYSYWWTEPDIPRVKKISAYSPAFIGDGFLTVSAVIDYNDIYVPVAEGFFKLALVFAGILAAILLMVWYLGKLLLQKQKDSEQISYLLELNRILEDMHQSEENIAHQQRLQIMGTMTGGIAHEFNNLLTPIMGYADLLLMELPEDSELYDNALEIYEASVKAKEIIQQLSSLSRKNMETAYKNLNSVRVLKRALKMVRSVCPANVRLEDEIHSDGACFLGNETQINQVILNICVNAIHAIGHQDGVLSVSAEVTDKEELTSYTASVIPDDWSRYIRIDIRDNGCGMSEDVMKQIFDPFFTTKKGGQGTGLGLALVEQIITSHRGYVFAESEPNKGSVFHICLPVNEQEVSDEDGLTLAGWNAGENMRLLIADDNPKVLHLLEKSFARLQVPVNTCMNFDEARNLLKQKEFDALVADQYIAGKSAVDFCMSIQGQYPDMLTIIMADRVEKELLEAKQRGVFDAYIGKPVSDSSILEAVKSNLNNL